MAVGAVDGTEPLILVSTRIRSIGCGYEDDITFVSLHIFEILNEEAVLTAFHLLLIGHCEWVLPQATVE